MAEEKLPVISAKIVVVETGETTEHDFENATVMVENMLMNMTLAEIVYGRKIKLDTPNMDPASDKLHLDFRFEDTGELYITVDAVRHPVQ